MNRAAIHKIREFNRFYTHFLGLLDQYILHSKYTLPEVRVLYELYHIRKAKASDIVEALEIDKSYLSRMLLQFERKNLIIKKTSRQDKRSVHLQLSSLGKKEFLTLNKASDTHLNELLSNMSIKDLAQLINHMKEIRRLIEENKKQ
ncbi:MAG: MarR family transcriptional regulator [Bacteroidetes bacterium]|nr:MAG: MarR family transcriptional regulator [Bacteroidota bacterium]